MTQIKNQEDLKKLGTILGVWAHPDDESYSMGAIMAAAVQNGQEVACITATRGEAGVQDESRWPADKLAEIREQELILCLEIIGGVRHHWLEYRDGHLENVDASNAVQAVAELMAEIQPDTILTFGPDGFTGHPDHVAANAWAHKAAALQTGKVPKIFHSVITEQRYNELIGDDGDVHNIFFNIDKPPVYQPKDCDILFCASEDILETKYQALKAQASQTAIMIEKSGEENYKKGLMEEAFVLAR